MFDDSKRMGGRVMLARSLSFGETTDTEVIVGTDSMGASDTNLE